MNLSSHFTLEELCHSQEGTRRGIANDPSPAIIQNLRALCENILEPLREHFGPFSPTSCYRSPALNTAIGGSTASQHMEGRAADLIINGHTPAEVFNWVTQNLPFDQVIREFPPGGWIHVSYDPARNRRACLLAKLTRKGVTYTPIEDQITV